MLDIEKYKKHLDSLTYNKKKKDIEELSKKKENRFFIAELFKEYPDILKKPEGE